MHEPFLSQTQAPEIGFQNCIYQSLSAGKADVLAPGTGGAYACIDQLNAKGVVVRLHQTANAVLAVCVNHGAQDQSVTVRLTCQEAVTATVSANSSVILRFPAPLTAGCCGVPKACDT